jgi:hypothetical protein
MTEKMSAVVVGWEIHRRQHLRVFENYGDLNEMLAEIFANFSMNQVVPKTFYVFIAGHLLCRYRRPLQSLRLSQCFVGGSAHTR